MKLRFIILNAILLLYFNNCHAAFTKIGGYASGSEAVSCDVSGDYAYIANYNGLIEILNVSHPQSPVLVSYFQLNDHVQRIDGKIIIHDTLAFILGFSNLHVLDVTNPSAPVYIAKWNYFGQDMIISGHLAYLAAGNYFKTIDFSDIQHPVTLDSLYRNFDGICMNGSLVYGIHASSPPNLFAVDISDPENLVLIDPDFDMPVYGNSDIGYRDSHLFVVYGYDLWSVDISDPMNPVILDTLNMEDITFKIMIRDDKAFITNYTSGFSVIDISDPSNLSMTGYYDTPGGCLAVIPCENMAFVADSYDGLQIVDVSDPYEPWLLSSFQTMLEAEGIGYREDIVYLSDYNGLDIIDITDITDPFLVKHDFHGWGIADEVSVHGTHLCFSHSDEWPQLSFLDATFPEEPVLLDTINMYGGYYYYYGPIPVEQDDHYVYAGMEHSLRIYDISDFSSPFQVASFETPDDIIDVKADSNIAYISLGETGIWILGLENITSPQLLGSYDTPGFASHMAFRNHTLIVADGTGGVQFIDVTDPAFPIVSSSIKPRPDSDISANLILEGNELIIADRHWNEFSRYDISDISDVRLEKSWMTNHEIYRFIYRPDVFLCSVSHYGMVILDSSPLLAAGDDMQDGGENNMLIVYPNPSLDVINLENVRSGSVYRIIDINGKMVMSGLAGPSAGISIAGLAQGMYILEIICDQKVTREKIFKI